jgi:methionyl aminopeptidase
MISIKNKSAIQKMVEAGKRLSSIFSKLPTVLDVGRSTLEVDHWIARMLVEKGLTSRMKGYQGYQYVSCISINDVVVHGIPHQETRLKEGDLVKIDVCASWQGYCADMARPFFVGTSSSSALKLVSVAQSALDKGIECASVGNRLTDISAAIQTEVERYGFGVVRDFAGHGIGKRMHEDPEILNYGAAGKGPILQQGMAFALEPMITVGKYDVFVDHDNWTVKTVDGSLACHVEDTIIVTHDGPVIITREVE